MSTTLHISHPPIHVLNLTAWFVSVPLDGNIVPTYLVLEEAMEKNADLVKETGNVNELLIDNPTEIDLFIQAGDIVKGGRQDRSIGADFIVPKRSTGLPIPVFCVEAGRWSKRRSESDQFFRSSKDFVASKKVRSAIRVAKNQGEVWNTISEHQTKIGESVGASVLHAASPSSLQLSYEMKETAGALEQYGNALDNVALPDDAAGVVWSINGKPSHGDVYADSRLFRKVWNKLQRAAAIEALEERLSASTDATTPTHAPAQDAAVILEWLEGTANAKSDEENLPPRTRLTTRRTASQVRFDTLDTHVAITPVHISVLAQ